MDCRLLPELRLRVEQFLWTHPEEQARVQDWQLQNELLRSMLRPVLDPTAVALPVTAIVNAAMAVPFALRILLPGLREAQQGYGLLCQSLGITGWSRLRLVTLPRLRRPWRATWRLPACPCRRCRRPRPTASCPSPCRCLVLKWQPAPMSSNLASRQ